MSKLTQDTVKREVVSTVEEPQYTLTMNEKEFRLLGCFAYTKIGGGNPLYKLLAPLCAGLAMCHSHAKDPTFWYPYSEAEGAEVDDICEKYLAPHVARKRIGELNDELGMLRKELGRVQSALAEAQANAEHTGRLTPPPVQGGSWHAAGEVEATPAPAPRSGLWKVQYLFCGVWVGGIGSENGNLTSRNQAYRNMRVRARTQGNPVKDYRVVPQETPDGIEKDRGYYRVQTWNKWSKEWVTVQWEANTSHDTVEAAQEYISTLYEHSTYRIKWFANA